MPLNKTAVLQAIMEALRLDFDKLRGASRQTRASGNDEESKAEGKYDTRSTEDNYLADGLAKQARAAAQSAAAYENFVIRPFPAGEPVDLGALVQLEFPYETSWFFLGPAGGGLEVNCGGAEITVLTPESPLGRLLLGLRPGDSTASPRATVRAVE